MPNVRHFPSGWHEEAGTDFVTVVSAIWANGYAGPGPVLGRFSDTQESFETSWLLHSLAKATTSFRHSESNYVVLIDNNTELKVRKQMFLFVLKN